MRQSEAADFWKRDAGRFEGAKGFRHGGTGGDDIIYDNEGVFREFSEVGQASVINAKSIYQIFQTQSAITDSGLVGSVLFFDKKIFA